MRVLSPAAFVVQLARAHRALFAANQRRIAAQIGTQSASFVAYEKRYLVHSRQATRVVEGSALLAQVRHAKWLFVGDYHTLTESRAQFLALLEPLLADGTPHEDGARTHAPRLVVALEYFATPEQAALNAYVSGTLDEAALRRRTHHAGKLPVGDATWHSYVPLLRWARRHRALLVALDAPRRGGASLSERDRHAAQVLAQVRRRLPSAQICVLAGQLHVMPGHLPRAVAEALAQRRGRTQRTQRNNVRAVVAQPLAALDALTLYQNSEAPFLRQLMGGTAPLGTTLQVSRRVFVLMNTAPIAAQASFLRALEAGREELQALDLGEQLVELARQAAHLLGYSLPPGLDAWEALPAGQKKSVVGQLGRHSLSVSEQRALHLRLGLGLPAWLPRAQRLWVPRRMLGETPHPSLAGLLLWLHAQKAGGVPRGRLGIALGEALGAASGVVCAQLLHPRTRMRPLLGDARRIASPAPGGRHRPLRHGDKLGEALGAALAEGLFAGRIEPSALLGLFAPPPATMAGFARWARLAGLTPRLWQHLLPTGR